MITDQIMNPLDKAVYWIEHAVKHKNAFQISKTSFQQSFIVDYCIYELITLMSVVVISLNVIS